MNRSTPKAASPPSAGAPTASVRPRPPATPTLESATATPPPVAAAPRGPVTLHIDHLVVDGFEVRDPGAFQAALEHELTRRVADDPTVLAKLASAQRRTFESPALRGASSEALGVAVARRLVAGFEEDPS